MDPQTIAYIAFGIVPLCALGILIIRLLRPSSRRSAKNIRGNLIMGDVQGDVNQNYTAPAPAELPAQKGRDWHDKTTLILGALSAVVGTVISALTYINGQP